MWNNRIGILVFVSGFIGWSRNNQWSSSFVDQDRVNLVHDCEVVTTLHTGREVKLHIVAQVVEAKLIVSTVRYISGVSGLAFEVIHIVLDATDFQSKEPMYLAHPLSVA